MKAKIVDEDGDGVIEPHEPYTVDAAASRTPGPSSPARVTGALTTLTPGVTSTARRRRSAR